MGIGGVLVGGFVPVLGPLVGGEAEVSYLLRDEFTTPESAPLTSPRTCEPGPGNLDIQDTGSHLSISSEELHNDGAYVATGDPGISSNITFSRSAGLLGHWQVRTSQQRLSFGWNINQFSRVASPHGWENLDHTVFYVRGTRNDITLNVYYDCISIQRSSGYFHIIKGGSEYTEFTLLAVTSEGSDDRYVTLTQFSAINDWRINLLSVAQLGAPWNDDYGIATQRLAGSRSPGDIYTHEADHVGELTIDTLPSSGEIEDWFRSPTVGTDGWRYTIDSGGNLDLDEVSGGTPVQRGTSAGVIAPGEVILLVCDDETIKVHDSGQRINYTGASTFKTATGGEIESLGTGGAASDKVLWPRILSGAALSTLEEYV